MLIPLSQIIRDHGVPPGVIHLGAHQLEERPAYLAAGISCLLWVEADPDTYAAIQKTDLLPREKILNFAAADVDDVEREFYVASNGQSSSLFPMQLHHRYHPEITVTCVRRVPCARMDTVLAGLSWPVKDVGLVNLDLQGAELLALRGFGDLLRGIPLIYTEVSTAPLYRNAPLIGDIDEYLARYGLRRVLTQMTRWDWGDALYAR